LRIIYHQRINPTGLFLKWFTM